MGKDNKQKRSVNRQREKGVIENDITNTYFIFISIEHNIYNAYFIFIFVDHYIRNILFVFISVKNDIKIYTLCSYLLKMISTIYVHIC